MEPTTLYTAFQHEAERFHHLTLYSGLAFGDYPFFLRTGLGTNFRYVTWQAAPRLRHLFQAKKVGFVPIRLSEIPHVVNQAGDQAGCSGETQVSPPAQDGTVSLGISVSLSQDFIQNARLVIAEINLTCPSPPVTVGCPWTRFTWRWSRRRRSGVSHATPKRTRPAHRRLRARSHSGPRVGPAWRRRCARSSPLSPRGKSGINLYSGMLSQGLVHFVEQARHAPQIITGELAGDQALYDLCGQTPQVTMATVHVTHNLLRLAQLPRFVSINSAVEIDLQGQSNGETLGEVQISGVGGSLDYIEAAASPRRALDSRPALHHRRWEALQDCVTLDGGGRRHDSEVLHGLYRDGVWRCSAQGERAPCAPRH